MCYKVDEIKLMKYPSTTAKKCMRAGLKIEGVIRAQDTKDVLEFWAKHAKEIMKTWPASR